MILLFRLQIILMFYKFLKLLDLLLKPFDDFFDDYDRANSANIEEIFWSGYQEGRTIKVVFLD